MTRADILEHCPHEQTAVRYLVNAAQARMWCRQCLICGRRVGDWLSKGHPAVLAVTDPELFDDALKARIQGERDLYFRQRMLERQIHWRDERDAEMARKRAEAENAWQEQYAAYRLTPEWKSLRQRVFARAAGVCEGCGVLRATEVHHLSYEHLGNEFLWELRAVCRPCHARWHDKDIDHAA
jgi:5-methylcytosine-specific restriction endonuclease McrA